MRALPRVVAVAACLGAGLALPETSLSAPYASGITNNGGTIQFYLNETPAQAYVVFDNGASNQLNNPQKGTNSFSLGAHLGYSIYVVGNSNATPYQTSLDTNQFNFWPTPRGVAANWNPTNGPTFGRIYVANSTPGTHTLGTNVYLKGRGLYMLNSDLTVSSDGNGTNALAAGVWTVSANSPYRMSCAEDGSLYVADYASNSATIWRFGSRIDFTNQMLAVIGEAAGVAAGIHGDSSGEPVATGSVANGNLTLWTLDTGMPVNAGALGGSTILGGQNDIVGPTTNGAYNNINKYAIGSGPLPASGWSNAPTESISLGLSGIGPDTIVVDVDIGRVSGNIFGMMYRLNFGEPCIQILDPTGQNLLWDSIHADGGQTNAGPDYFSPTNFTYYTNSDVSGNPTGNPGTYNGLVTGAFSVKVSPDEKFIAVGLINNSVVIMKLTNGIPDPSTEIFFLNPPNDTGHDNLRGITIDAADNIYTVSSGQGLLRSISLGAQTICITSNDITSTNGAFQMAAPWTKPIFVSEPQALITTNGNSATLTASIVSVGTVGYQWVFNGTNVGNGGQISGAQSNSLVISGVTPTNAGNYYLIVTNTSGAVTSAVVSVQVVSSPVFQTLYPPAINEAAGDHVAYQAYATGSNFVNYQWYFQGAPLSQQTASTLVLTNIQTNMSGTYLVTAVDATGLFTTNSVLLNVSPTPLPLYSSNLIVARLGDGAQTLSGATGNTLYLDQYTTNGTYVSTLMIPDESSGQAYGTGSSASVIGSPALLLPGAGSDAPREGYLTKSYNQQFLCFAGYCLNYPYSGADVTTSTTNYWRGLGVVDAFGYYTLAYTNTGLYSLGNHTIRSAATLEGTVNFWTTGQAGSGGGLKYVNSTATAYASGSGIPADATATPAGTEVVQVLSSSNLFYSDWSGATHGIYESAGSPQPGPSGSFTSTLVLNEGGQPNDFAISPDGGTIYIADSQAFTGTTNEAGGIERWDTTTPGSNYVFSYTLPAAPSQTNGAVGLTVAFPTNIGTWGPGARGAVLYATTYGASSNSLTQMTDNGAASTPTAVVTVPANVALRGVRFGPSPLPVTDPFAVQPVTANVGQNITLSIDVTADPAYSYQWQFNGTNIAGATGTNLALFNVQFSQSGIYSVVINSSNGSVSGPAVAFQVADFAVWTGGDLGDTNWSDALNWQPSYAPPAGAFVTFNNTDAETNSALSTPGGGPSALMPGFEDNLVDYSVAISSLTFTNTGSNYHNTYLAPGVTLAITNSGGMWVGTSSGFADFGSNGADFVTISGPSANLAVNNTNAEFFVGCVTTSAGGFPQAELDMSALGSFDATVGVFSIAGIGSTTYYTSATAYLARTNLIIANGGSVNENSQAETLSFMVGGTGKGAVGNTILYLGWSNAIYANSIGVSLAKEQAQMKFNPLVTNQNPVAIFRAADGASPVSVWSIGDGLGQTGGSAAPLGVVDFTGGQVNALVNTMYIGRSPNVSGAHVVSGTLTFGAGTVTAGTIYAGYQAYSDTDSGMGTVNVNGSAVLAVTNVLNLGLVTGGGGVTNSGGALNISGMAAVNSIACGIGSVNTVNLNGGMLVVTNTAGSPAAPLSALHLTGGTLGLYLNGSVASTNIVTAAITTSGTTTINLASVTNISNGVEYPLLSYTGSDPYGSLSLVLPAGYTGALVDDTAHNLIGVAVTNEQLPQITSQPTNLTVSAGGTAVFTAGIGGGATTFATNEALNLYGSNNPPSKAFNSNPPYFGYPSIINVSGMTGNITGVTVTISNFGHTYPSDVAMVLVSPAGQATYLMNDCGGGSGVNNLNLTFSQTASNALPKLTALASGTYLPTNYGFSIFPSNASGPTPPVGGIATNLGVFNGYSPNGAWAFYVADESVLDSGYISNGWSVNITTGAGPVAYQWQFDGTNLTDGGQISGSLTSALSIGSVLVTNSGSYDVIVSDTFGSVTSVVATLQVPQGVPGITWSNPAPITYGTGLTASQLNAMATVPGNFVYNPALGTILNTGTNILSSFFTPTDTNNYSQAMDSVSIVVLPAGLTVTANSTNRQAGAGNPSFTGVIAGVVNGDNITASYSSTASQNSPAGAYPIIPALVDPGNRASNYSVTLVNGTLTVFLATNYFPYSFTTLAGQPSANGSADGVGNSARFFEPNGVAIDGAGNAYVADYGNSTIRRISTNGAVATIAGLARATGTNDGIGTNARFNSPLGIAVDAATNLYISDSGNNTIRKASLVGTNWIVTTLAGLAGTVGSSDGIGTNAEFSGPNEIAFDGGGNLYVADEHNDTIRKISATGSNWNVTTVAGRAGSIGSVDGTGTNARFYMPTGVTVDTLGNLYVADWGNATIRKISSGGTVTTLAGLARTTGSADGVGSSARFGTPNDIAIDANGNLYISDYFSSTIRRATLVGTNWVVTTLGGLPEVTGTNDGAGPAARFFYPAGIAVDALENVYVADVNNQTIRKGIPPEPVIVNAPQSLTVSAGGQGLFTVLASGSPPLGYQWQFDGTNLTDGGQVNGSLTSALSISGALVTNSGSYDVIISNAYGAVTSVVAVLDVNQGVPTMNWTNPAPIIYGTPLTSNQLNAAASVPGNFIYNPNFGAIPGLGTNLLSVIFNPFDSVNYTSVTDTVSLSVLAPPYNPGDLIIVNAYDTNLYRFQPLTKQISVVAAVGVQANDVAFGDGTNIGLAWVAVPDSNLLEELNLATGLVSPFASGRIQSVAYHNGLIYATERTQSVLVYAAGSGALLNTYTDPSASSFLGVRYDSVNNRLVLTDQIQGALYAMTLGGAFSLLAGPWGYNYAYLPDVEPNGDVLISDTYGEAILRIDVNNTNAISTVYSGAPLSDSTGVTEDGDNHIYAANFGDGNLVMMNADGSGITNLGYIGAPGGMLYSVVVVPSTSFTNPAIVEIQPSSLITNAGALVQLYCEAGGALPLSYRWQFNGTNLNDGGQISGSSAEVLTISGALSRNSGSYTMTASNAYGLETSAVATLHVPQILPTITWSNPAPITYGAILTTNQLNATANVPGSFVYTPSLGGVLNAGTNTLTAVFNPSDPVDYLGATNTVTIAVSPASLTVTATNLTRQYGQANPLLTGTITGLTNNDNITANYSCSATAVSPQGSYAIVPSLVDPNNRATNYTVHSNNGALTVVQPLSVVSSNDPVLTVPDYLAPVGIGLAVAGMGTNGADIFLVPAASNSAVTLYSARNPQQIAVLGTNLYWVDPSSSPSHFCQIFRAPTNGSGPVTTVYTGGPFGPLYAGSGLASDGISLYAADETNGAIFRLSINGNSLTPVQIATNRYTGVAEHLNTISVINGVIYVADAGQGPIPPQVLAIPTNGSVFTVLALGAPLVAPAGIAASTNNLVYVSDPQAGNTIWQLPVTGGAPVAFLAGSPFNHPQGLAINPPNLYIADAGADTIYAAPIMAGLLPMTPPVITWTTPAAVTYGTALSSAQLNATANTQGTFIYSPGPGTELNSGTYPLTVVFNPTDTTDYTSATNTVSLQVLPASLSVTASNATRGLGQANPAFGGTIFGLVNGDNITASYSTTAIPSSPPGSYSIVPTLVDPGNRATNYNVTLNNGILTIGSILIWSNPAPIYYGTALGSNQLNAVANVPGSFAYTPNFGMIEHPGTYPLSVTFTPSNTVNYDTTNATVQLTVLPAALTVTAANANRGYGQANPAFPPPTILGLVNGDNITTTSSCSATTNSPVGSYPIVPALIDPQNLETNYTVTLVNGTLTVTVLPSSTYTEAYTFTTLAGYPGFGTSDGVDSEFNHPSAVALDGVGNVYVADTDNDTIRMVTPAGVASTIAGVAGSVGSADGAAHDALFNYPSGIALDSSGNIYVADTYNSTIRMITPAGMVSTLAGMTGNPGSADGIGTAAQFNYPSGIAVDVRGIIYVADSLNNTIREIAPGGGQWTVSTVRNAGGGVILFGNPSGVAVDVTSNIYVADTGNNVIREISAGVVTLLAGQMGNSGSQDGIGAASSFNSPFGISVSSGGALFIGDMNNNTIRELTFHGSTWSVNTIAGSPASAGHNDATGSAASFNSPMGVIAGTNGDVYVADAKNGLVRHVTSAEVVSTIAGSTGGSGSADGPGAGARFDLPAGVAVDGADNLYVADTVNNTIRRITSAGIVSTYAGSEGNPGSADGAGSVARFDSPSGVAVDAPGNVYVTDSLNGTIRMINPAQVVTTIAGTAGNPGAADGTGSSAQFDYPTGLAVDTNGNIYVADTYNSTIRMITPARVVTTIAGSAEITGSRDGEGASAQFTFPFAIAVDTNGNLYVADTFNDTIRKISPSGPNWFVTTIAGSPGEPGFSDGIGTMANFNEPQGIGIDAAGNLYIADTGNQTIRLLAPSSVTWVSSTIGGTNSAQPGSQDGTGSDARFYHPEGIAADSIGTVFVADTDNNTIRRGSYAQYVPSQSTTYSQPTMNGGLSVTLLPAEANGQWRFAWDLFWRNSGEIVNNLAPGDYPIELTAENGYAVPSEATVSVTNDMTNYWTSECYPGPGYGETQDNGQLTVNLLNNVGGWGFLGSIPPYFTTANTTLSLSPGTYDIGFEPVPGYVTPENLAVTVTADQTTTVPVNYSVAPGPPEVSLPDAVALGDLGKPPYVFNGQLQTDVGFGSGVAALENVVLTAAHNVFNDNALNYVTNAYWFLQQETGLPQADPLAARGCYILSGYAAQRTNDSKNSEWSPGESTAGSRDLDVAAVYFPAPVAGGGFGGYLPSDESPNEWLTGSENKMLVGYPVDGSEFGIDSVIAGGMYVTGPQHAALTLDTETVAGQQEVYVASWFLSYPGNSGGPLYAQLNGSYYPAGVYLGTLYSGNQPIGSAVRAIDSNVVNILADAQALGASGTNHSGGGTETFVAGQGVSGSSLFGISISPSGALAAGAAWEFVGQNGTQWSSSDTTTYQSVSTSGSYQVEFKIPNGWSAPVNVPSVTVTLGQNPSPVAAAFTLALGNWPNPASISYGTALAADSTILAGIEGAFSYSDSSQNQYAVGSVLNAGNYTLTLSFVPSSSYNGYYGGAASIGPASLQVVPAPLTVTADSQTQVYGQFSRNFTVNGGFTTVTGLMNQTFAVTFTTSPSITGTNPSAGSYTIIPALVDPGNLLVNYTVTLNSGTLTIAKRPVSVPPTNFYIGTNQAVPQFGTIPVSGPVNIRLSCPSVGSTSIPGSYPLAATLSGTGSGNYTITDPSPGSLFILPGAPLQSAQINGQSITFSWTAVAGAQYEIQSIASLASTNWQTIGTVTSIGTTESATVPLNGAQQFYRVIAGPH